MSPIKTALLSFGMSGRFFHAPFITAHKGFELSGAWERSKKTIEAVYPGTKSYASLQEILADSSIQLVIVNTPNSTHYEFTKAALLAGKDVLTEKAFTTTVKEAIELKELAQQTGRKLTVYQSRRWDSDFNTVRKIKESGVIGEVVNAEFRYERCRTTISPKQHKESAGPGGGLLNDLGPHLIDQALTLFGMPNAVYADIRITRPLSQTDDWFDITLHYPHCRARLVSGMYMREPLPAFVFHGTLGTFIKSRADVQETDLQEGKTPNLTNWGIEPESEWGLLHTEKDGKIIKEKIKSETGNYYFFYDAVHKAITENAALPVSCDEAINVMKIIEAAVRSSKEKRVIEL
jgi:scyllo-inositol 2-dehydrogenase (NADP+)